MRSNKYKKFPLWGIVFHEKYIWYVEGIAIVLFLRYVENKTSEAGLSATTRFDLAPSVLE